MTQPPRPELGRTRRGTAPASSAPAGPHPAGPHPAGQHPAGPHPAGQHPAGPHPAGQHPAGPHPAGPSRPGLSIRVDLPSGRRIGPGKVALLRQVAATGSISAAGRALKMSYRRAWDLIDDLNGAIGTPVVATSAGGAGGGGARLTAAGQAVIEQYDAIVADAVTAVQNRLVALDRLSREV